MRTVRSGWWLCGASGVLGACALGMPSASADVIMEGYSGLNHEVYVELGDQAGSVFFAHQIDKGDTLSALAKTYLGDAERWPEIVAANPGLDADALAIDDKVVIPPKAVPTGEEPRYLYWISSHYFKQADRLEGLVVANREATTGRGQNRVCAVAASKRETFEGLVHEKGRNAFGVALDRLIEDPKATWFAISEGWHMSTTVKSTSSERKRKTFLEVGAIDGKSVGLRERKVERRNRFGMLVDGEDDSMPQTAALGLTAVAAALLVSRGLRRRRTDGMTTSQDA